MPLTFPAHQAPLLPLKLWRPAWFDGTALVVGAATPDLHYAVDRFLPGRSHHWTGVLIFCVPFTLLYCGVLRRLAASGLFASFPDAGRFRLWSYRVLTEGRPAFVMTLLSATLAAASHVIIDSFTHSGRLAASWVGFDRVWFETPLRPVTTATVLQYLGHTVGTAAAIMLFIVIADRRHLERWYGAAAVATARAAPTHHRARSITVVVSAVATVVGLIWAAAMGQFPFFTVGLSLVVGWLVAGTIVDRISGPGR